MGCDIFYEVSYKEDNEWKSAGIEDWPYIDRNYELFAILANVRNSFDIIPIKDRGYLELEDTNSREYREDDVYAYHTLKNIKDYDWNQMINMHGLLKIKEYGEWIEKGKKERPKKYWSAMGGRLYIEISNEGMENIINNTPDKGEEISNAIFKCKGWPQNINFYTKVEWNETCAEISSNFYNEIIPRLQELADKYGGDENVRFLFGFNN